MVVLTGCDWYAIERIIYEDWLCTVNTDGTDLNYLRPAVGGYLVVTPDSERVISVGSKHIYSMDIDGSNLITLSDSIHTFHPRPSVAKTPGGNKVIFHGCLGNPWDIYEIDLETNELTNLTNTPDIHELDPHYSNDGTKIAYVTRTIPDSIITLSVMSYNGTNNRIIKEYNNPDSYDSYYQYPVFSHDDDKIFYIWSVPSTSEIERGLHSVNIDGSNDRYLFEGYFSFPVSTSAYGSKIVFYSPDSDNIYIMNEDGSDLTNLGPAGPYRPVFSSDGSEILFGCGHLYIMNSDGSERRQLTDDWLDDGCPYVVFLPDNKVMCSVERRVQ